MTPEEAFEAFVNGAEDCFEAAAPKLLQEVRAYLALLGVKNEEEREDIAAEAIFYAVNKSGKLCGMGAEGVCGYLFVICKNRVIDRTRARRRNVARPTMHISKPTIDPVLREALEYCISRLPDDIQAMFRAHFLEGLPKKRIAQLKGVAERTCQDHLRKAKSSVADCLRHQGYPIDRDEP